MKTKLHYIIFSFLLISGLYLGQAQEIGKIFTKVEANQKFPAIIKSFTLNNSTLISLLTESGKYIMFSVDNGNLIIAGPNRKVLYPNNATVSVNATFKVYSSDMVSKLFSLGKESTTTIEYRDDIISLTNGDYTLEESSSCPPFCN